MLHSGIKLMCEYTVTYPVWWDVGGMISRGALPTSEELDRDLVEWASNFNTHYDEEWGWPRESDMHAHVHQGERLLARLRNELAGRYTCRYDCWEKMFVPA